MQMKQKIYPWLIVLFSGLMCAVIANTYTIMMSLFLDPLVHALHAPLSAVSYFMTVTIIAMSVGFVLVGRYIRRVNFNLAFAGAVIMTAAAVAVLAQAHSLIVLYLTAIVIGLGCAFTGYIVQGILVNNWFVKRKNFAFSLCAFIVSLYLMFSSSFTAFLITKLGWRMALMTLAGISLVVGLLAAFILKLRPEDAGLKAYGADSAEQAADSTGEHESAHVETKSVIMSAAFVLVLVFYALVEFSGNIQSLIPVFATRSGFGAASGGLILTLVSAANIIVTPIFGLTTDKWGSKAVAGWILAPMAAMLLLILAAQTKSLILLYGSAILIAACSTVMGTGEQVFGAEMFGPAFDVGYANVSAVTGVIGAFATPIFSYIYEGSNSFTVVFIVVAAIYGLALV
ncbi:MFS transporter, partial [Lactobacillus sp. XV13L]|nr:MFS transporter [Lactobacillus sp. XV13L]